MRAHRMIAHLPTSCGFFKQHTPSALSRVSSFFLAEWGPSSVPPLESNAMRIKTLSLVGFKSYESLTTLPLFNRDYTVIAGPNGFGKSNLLDAIIFALGSTDANPQQLIYNEGRAGIIEASISIFFDNTEATW
ncbi:hypothetical protein NL676_016312 [Syzygium grande]|nr:hypothetical protein NL676_016312 [Syzygium grande]